MKILKPNEVSEILNVTVRTLQKWDRDGKLKAQRTPTTNRRYFIRNLTIHERIISTQTSQIKNS